MDESVDHGTLFLGCISIVCTEEELTELFSQHGTVVIVRIQRCSKTGTSLGYGFLTMSSEAEAERCIRELNGVCMRGRTMKVRKAGYGLTADGNNCTPVAKNPASRLFNFEAPTYTVHFKFRFTHPSCSINEVIMRNIFGSCGPINDVAIRKLSRDRATGLGCGYGFIHYADNEEGLKSALGVLATMKQITICNSDTQAYPTVYNLEASNNLLKHLQYLGVEPPSSPAVTDPPVVASAVAPPMRRNPHHQHSQHGYPKPKAKQNHLGAWQRGGRISAGGYNHGVPRGSAPRVAAPRHPVGLAQLVHLGEQSSLPPRPVSVAGVPRDWYGQHSQPAHDERVRHFPPASFHPHQQLPRHPPRPYVPQDYLNEQQSVCSSHAHGFVQYGGAVGESTPVRQSGPDPRFEPDRFFVDSEPDAASTSACFSNPEAVQLRSGDDSQGRYAQYFRDLNDDHAPRHQHTGGGHGTF